MVHTWANEFKQTTPFENDGTFIPPWGHLYMSVDEMRTALAKIGSKELIDKVLHFIYTDPDINRYTIAQIDQGFERARLRMNFKSVYKMCYDSHKMPNDVYEKVKDLYPDMLQSDFAKDGCIYILQKL